MKKLSILWGAFIASWMAVAGVRVGAINCGQFHYPIREATAGEYSGGWKELIRDNSTEVFFFEDVGSKKFPEDSLGTKGLDIRVKAGIAGKLSVVELPRTIEIDGHSRSTSRYRALKYVAEYQGRTIAFFGVHLVAEGHIKGPKQGGLSASQQMRQKQFEALINEGNRYDYAVFAGDFNAQRADEYDIFTKAGYKIANGSREFGTKATLRKIPADNIIVSKKLELSGFKIPDFYALDTDHFPVFAEIDFADQVQRKPKAIPSVAEFLELTAGERREWFKNEGFRKAAFAENYPKGEGLLSRWVKIDNIPNLRDVGGMKTIDGGELKRGVYYRSAGWNDNSIKRKSIPQSEWKVGKNRLTAKGREQLKAVGIKTDLDLRNESEVWGMTGSPLGSEVEWVHIPFGAYEQILASAHWRKQVVKAFEVLADKERLPLVFHCIGGADRTGCLAMMIELLAGVDEDTALRDWELTMCYTARMNFVHEQTIDGFLRDVRACEGATMEAKMRVYLEKCGVTKELQDAVRGNIRD